MEIENIEDEGRISEIEINGDTVFSENVAYRPDAEIIIAHHTFKRMPTKRKISKRVKIQ